MTTTKMQNVCALVEENAKPKCFDTLDYVNNPRKHIANEIYMFHMIDSKLLSLLLFLCIINMQTVNSKECFDLPIGTQNSQVVKPEPI